MKLTRYSLAAAVLSVSCLGHGCATTPAGNSPADLAAAPKGVATTQTDVHSKESAAAAAAITAPKVPVDPTKQLADAKAELLANHPQHASELLRGASEPMAMTLLALAEVAASKDAANPAAAMAQAMSITAELSQKEGRSPRTALLRVYVENPTLRSEKLRNQLMDGAATPYDLTMALVGIHSAAGDWVPLLADLRQAETYKPNDPQLIISIFTTAVRAKDWATAQEYVEKGATLNVDKVGGVAMMGALNVAKGNHAAAIVNFKKQVELRPDYAAGWFDLAREYSFVRDYASVQESAEKGLALQPDSAIGLKEWLYAETSGTTLRHPEAAREQLAKARRVAPNDADVENYADRIETRTQVIERRTARMAVVPADNDNRRRLAIYLAADRQFDKAMDVFKPVYTANPKDISAVDVYANLVAQGGDVERAEALFTPFMTNGTNEDRAKAMLLAGAMLESQRMLDRAIDLYSRAVMTDGQNELAKRHLGDVYFLRQSSEQAVKIYEDLLRAHPDDPGVRRRVAESYIRLGKYDQAAPMIETLQKENPKDMDLVMLKGFSAMMQGKTDEAIQVFGQVLEVEPGNETAEYYRAMTRIRANRDLPEAVTELERATAADPRFVGGWRLLVTLYEKNHRNDAEEQAFGHLMQLVPANSDEGKQIRAEYERFRSSIAEPKI